MAGYLFVVVTAAIVSWAATHWVRREAPRWGLVDHPGGRKRHRAPTPTAGGLAIWLALVGALAIGQTVPWAVADSATVPDAAARSRLTGSVEDRAVGVLLAAATALAVLGLIDDLRGLSWRLRLVVQGLVAGLAVWLWSPLLLPHPPVSPWLVAALSTVWLVALVNAFNMLDNMDGLSAGVAAIVTALLAGMALLASGDSPEGPAGSAVLLFLLALIGSLLGFLWHNRWPARAFMGDFGSYLVGFSVSAAALLVARGAGVVTGGDHPAWIPAAALLCIFAIPLYDMASVVLIRLSQGRSPFLPDRNHLSHRLVGSGLSERRAVQVIYLATAACGLPALLLLRLDPAVAPAVLSGAGGLLATLAVVDTFRWRRTRAAEVGAQSGPDPLAPSPTDGSTGA